MIKNNKTRERSELYGLFSTSENITPFKDIRKGGIIEMSFIKFFYLKYETVIGVDISPTGSNIHPCYNKINNLKTV